MSWIDTVVVGIIIVGGLFIFYRALKEPLDLFFGAIRKGFDNIRDKIGEMRDERSYEEVITYGGNP